MNARDVRCGVLVAALCLLALASGTGCGQDGAPDLDARVRAEIRSHAATAREEGWTEQADALDDGVLTDAEIDSLHSLYRECMAKTDADLSEAHRSPIDGRTWIEWETNPPGELTAADNEPTQACQVRFRDISGIDLRPKAMAEPLRQYVQSCLVEVNVEVDEDDRDIQEIYRRAGEGNVGELGRCITAGMAQEYPEIEGYSWGPPGVY